MHLHYPIVRLVETTAIKLEKQTQKLLINRIKCLDETRLSCPSVLSCERHMVQSRDWRHVHEQWFVN